MLQKKQVKGPLPLTVILLPCSHLALQGVKSMTMRYFPECLKVECKNEKWDRAKGVWQRHPANKF